MGSSCAVGKAATATAPKTMAVAERSMLVRACGTRTKDAQEDKRRKADADGPGDRLSGEPLINAQKRGWSRAILAPKACLAPSEPEELRH